MTYVTPPSPSTRAALLYFLSERSEDGNKDGSLFISEGIVYFDAVNRIVIDDAENKRSITIFDRTDNAIVGCKDYA